MSCCSLKSDILSSCTSVSVKVLGVSTARWKPATWDPHKEVCLRMWRQWNEHFADASSIKLGRLKYSASSPNNVLVRNLQTETKCSIVFHPPYILYSTKCFTSKHSVANLLCVPQRPLHSRCICIIQTWLLCQTRLSPTTTSATKADTLIIFVSWRP